MGGNDQSDILFVIAEGTLLCFGNRFLAQIGENWHTPSKTCKTVAGYYYSDNF